jgi:hypothetical protein
LEYQTALGHQQRTINNTLATLAFEGDRLLIPQDIRKTIRTLDHSMWGRESTHRRVLNIWGEVVSDGAGYTGHVRACLLVLLIASVVIG